MLRSRHCSGMVFVMTRKPSIWMRRWPLQVRSQEQFYQDLLPLTPFMLALRGNRWVTSRWEWCPLNSHGRGKSLSRISQGLTRNQKQKRYEGAVVDVTSTLLSSTLYCCRGGSEYVASYIELVIRSDAGGEFTAQAVTHQCQDPITSIDLGPANQTQSQWSAERTMDCHWSLAPCLQWDKCVLAGFSVWPQILTHPSISNLTPFDLLFDWGACTQLDYVMHVIGVLPCRSLMFVMPVLNVCQACHQLI